MQSNQILRKASKIIGCNFLSTSRSIILLHGSTAKKEINDSRHKIDVRNT
jgi:hypothetical protein